jgi:hypothetical protein
MTCVLGVGNFCGAFCGATFMLPFIPFPASDGLPTSDGGE